MHQPALPVNGVGGPETRGVVAHAVERWSDTLGCLIWRIPRYFGGFVSYGSAVGMEVDWEGVELGREVRRRYRFL